MGWVALTVVIIFFIINELNLRVIISGNRRLSGLIFAAITVFLVVWLDTWGEITALFTELRARNSKIANEASLVTLKSNVWQPMIRILLPDSNEIRTMIDQTLHAFWQQCWIARSLLSMNRISFTSYLSKHSIRLSMRKSGFPEIGEIRNMSNQTRWSPTFSLPFGTTQINIITSARNTRH